MRKHLWFAGEPRLRHSLKHVPPKMLIAVWRDERDALGAAMSGSVRGGLEESTVLTLSRSLRDIGRGAAAPLRRAKLGCGEIHGALRGAGPTLSCEVVGPSTDR